MKLTMQGKIQATISAIALINDGGKCKELTKYRQELCDRLHNVKDFIIICDSDPVISSRLADLAKGAA